MEVIEQGVGHEENEPKDQYNLAYLIHFFLGVANLVPWNALITAVDYFEYIYPNRHVDKVFSVAFMGTSSMVIALLMVLSSMKKLPDFRTRMNLGYNMFMLSTMTPPVTDWIVQGKGNRVTYGILIVSLIVCGSADGLAAGSLVGSIGLLPGRYMQAVFSGNASSGVLVCILRIITKASLPSGPDGLRTSAHIYFTISTIILLVGIILSNVLNSLPIIRYYKEKVPNTTTTTNTNLLKDWRNFLGVLKKIRVAAIGVLLTFIVTLSIFPGYLTDNVESKTLGDWYPILLLTIYNVTDLIGRCLTSLYMPKNIGKTTIASMTRLLLYPLYLSCIIGPKWLKSEFMVGSLTAALGATNGYFTSVLMVLAPKSVLVHEAETVGIIMALCLMGGLAIGSVLGWLWNL